MKTRQYKNTGKSISLLGFGFMRLPVKNGETSQIDEEAASAMVDYAIANGVNYFDTAYLYHDGQSELFAGKALSKYSRDSFYLATKMPIMAVSSEADVERIFDEQLEKCRVDYFDFYLIHNINKAYLSKMREHKIYEIVKEKQKQGKIKHLGFSFHDNVEVLAETLDGYEWDFAQIQLNYMDWEIQDAGKQYQMLKDKNIPVIVMEPLRGGVLATLCDKSIEIFKSENPSVSTASWALRYAASLPDVLTVLSGMTTMEQLEDNIKTLGSFEPLTSHEYDVIEKALTAYRETAAIPCTACRYCMDCPEGVDIPKVFSAYNNYLIGITNNRRFNDFTFDIEYRVLGEDKQANNCAFCNQCISSCPQHIDIPDWMQTIDEFALERKKANPAG